MSTEPARTAVPLRPTVPVGVAIDRHRMRYPRTAHRWSKAPAATSALRRLPRKESELIQEPVRESVTEAEPHPRDAEAMVSFQDVLVTPYTDLVDEPQGGLFHRGGPHWPHWDEQVEARHRRRDEPVDTEPIPAQAEVRIRGRVAWAGPVDWNYGHQVGDFSMRIVPTLAVGPTVRVAFSAHPRWGWRTIDDTPVYFRQILDWLGLPEEQCLFIDRPALVEELCVVPQAEQIPHPGPSPAHLDRMDELMTRRLRDIPRRVPALYVSRAGMHARLAGEAYLERAMIEAGARVIRPETLPLGEQLRAYASAEVLVFSEGSASTGGRLLGRSLGRVVVLLRRHQTSGDFYSRSQLTPRSRSLAYLDALHSVLCGTKRSGKPFEVQGVTLLDEAALLDGLSAAVPSLSDVWDARAYASARDEDVLAWVERSLGEWYLQGEVPRRHVLETLTATGLGHLVGPVEGYLAKRLEEPERSRPAPPTVGQPRSGDDPGPDVETPPRAESRPATLGRTTGAGPAAQPARPVNPRPWTAVRLNQLAEWAGLGSYLEIGVGSGSTFREVRLADRVGVDPRPAVDSDVLGQPGVRIEAITSDAFFAALDPGRRFDLVLIDGLRHFERAYRDLRAALLHTGPDSIILISDTLPRDAGSALRDPREAIRRQSASMAAGAAWQGDVFKVVLAIHDFHPGLDFATLNDWGSPQTMVWRSAHEPRRPRFGSLETISRLSWDDLQDHRDAFHPSGMADAWHAYEARSSGSGTSG